MTGEQEKEILLDALSCFGIINQRNKTIEELSELTKELCKAANNNGDNYIQIAEEIADVLIMVQQMILFYNIQDDVERFKLMKLKRLRYFIAEMES